MLPRSQRLSGDQVRSLMAGKSAVLHTPLFMVRHVATTPGTTSRFSVVVSKKVAKSAVLRNLLRRRLYSAIKKAGFPVGKDYVVSVKNKAIFSEYLQDLVSVAERL